jgi:hypothetical protein
LQFLRPSARELVLAALPAVDDLRSTTSRMALLFFQVGRSRSLGTRQTDRQTAINSSSTVPLDALLQAPLRHTAAAGAAAAV